MRRISKTGVKPNYALWLRRAESEMVRGEDDCRISHKREVNSDQLFATSTPTPNCGLQTSEFQPVSSEPGKPVVVSTLPGKLPHSRGKAEARLGAFRIPHSEFRIPIARTPPPLPFLLLFLLLLLSGCYEPQEGCLDLEAVNYDFSADENNTEDCNYPELRLQFNHRFVGIDSTYNFRFDSTYLDSEGNPFTFNDLRFYISNVRLLGANGFPYGVEEELTIFIPEDGDTSEVLVEDNFAIVSPRNSQTFTMGTMRESYSVNGIRFAVGVEGLANEGLPSRLISSHPLSLRDSSLYFSQDSGYVFNSISLFRDTTAADTIPEVLRIGTTPYLQIVELPLTEEKPRGFHYKVTLNIDYTKWFSGINVRQDTEEALIEKIVSNITESFSVIEVEIEGD